MYRDFYRMAKDPFAMHPVLDNYFRSRSHEQALHLLTESVRQGEPYILVSGEYGVGKTLLLLKLCRFLEEETDLLAVTVSSPSSPFAMLLKSIVLQLEETEAANSCRTASQLIEVLFNLYMSGKLRKSIYIIIDDIQDYEQQMLDNFRYLANFHVKDFYPFRLVCFAHSGFIEELEKNPKYIPFIQRFRRRLYIKPLQEDELKEYIYFLLLQSGAKGRPLFDHEALRFLADASKRIPRLINNLCDRVLLRASELGTDRIDLEMVRDVCHMAQDEDTPQMGQDKENIHIQLPRISGGEEKNNGRTTKKTGNCIDLNMIVQDTTTIVETRDEIASSVVSAPLGRRLWLTAILFGVAVLIIGFMFLWVLSLKMENVSPANGDQATLPSRSKGNEVTDSVFSTQSTIPAANNDQLPLYSQGDGELNADLVSGINTIKQDNGGRTSENGIGYQGKGTSSEKDTIGSSIKIHQMKAVDESVITADSSTQPGEKPYTLELFSGSTPSVTQTEFKRLQDKGMNPLFISEVATDHLAPRWNIYLGNFLSEEDARKSPWLVSVPEATVRRLPYSLLLVTPEKTGGIEGLQKILEADGYSPWLERLENGQHRLLLGAYSSRKEALSLMRELQQEGIAAVVVRR